MSHSSLGNISADTFLSVILARMVTVEVNSILTRLCLVDVMADLNVKEMVKAHNPDCFVILYAVDDLKSFGEFMDIME